LIISEKPSGVYGLGWGVGSGGVNPVGGAGRSARVWGRVGLISGEARFKTANRHDRLQLLGL